MPELTDQDGASPAGHPRILVEAFVTAGVVTAIVTVLSLAAPEDYAALSVGLTFLVATWVLIWRKEDPVVVRFGVALGGLVLGNKIAWSAIFRAAASALAWAFGFALVVFPLFWLGWRLYWAPRAHFVLTPTLQLFVRDVAEQAVGQILVIALPEEAFYRGYLQTRLDDALPPRFRILGAQIGPSLIIGSAIFAIGHWATVHNPARLAVFFPSLLFGWLRARTGGIGASLSFHALCNVLSLVLSRGYGLY